MRDFEVNDTVKISEHGNRILDISKDLKSCVCIIVMSTPCGHYKLKPIDKKLNDKYGLINVFFRSQELILLRSYI